MSSATLKSTKVWSLRPPSQHMLTAKQPAQHTVGKSQTLYPCHRISPTRILTRHHRYILDIGQSEDWLALQIAMFPCLLGYYHIAKRLHSIQDPSQPKNANRYRQWIDNYVAEDYTEAVTKGIGKSRTKNVKFEKTVLTRYSPGGNKCQQAVTAKD